MANCRLLKRGFCFYDRLRCTLHTVDRRAQRSFAHMPYVHSESALAHTQAVALFSQLGLEDRLRSALRHKAIIDRFGRYPHRNAVLGRSSTPQELAFLSEPGSSF